MTSVVAKRLDNKQTAAFFALTAMGVASFQDAIVKFLSADFGATQVLFMRGMGACPLLLYLLWREGGWEQMFKGPVKLAILRSAILCSAYLAFILSIAAMPIATTVSIYFLMPFIVAGLAGPALGENVALYRWVAVAAAFIGVLVMVQPGTDSFKPAMLFALYSAFGYAVGQLIGRRISHEMPISVISNWQNVVYTVTGLGLALIIPYTDITGTGDKSWAFLARDWIWPSAWQWGVLLIMGFLAALGSLLFVSAYKHAEANFVAPFEYTALIWATFYGILLFGDWPDRNAVFGVSIVIAAGIFMLSCDRRAKQSANHSTV